MGSILFWVTVAAVISAAAVHFTKLRPGLYRIRDVPCYGVKVERHGRGWRVAAVEYNPSKPTMTQLVCGECGGKKLGTFLVQNEDDARSVIESMKQGLRAMYERDKEQEAVRYV
jgi:hypothetical protein